MIALNNYSGSLDFARDDNMARKSPSIIVYLGFSSSGAFAGAEGVSFGEGVGAGVKEINSMSNTSVPRIFRPLP